MIRAFFAKFRRPPMAGSMNLENLPQNIRNEVLEAMEARNHTDIR